MSCSNVQNTEDLFGSRQAGATSGRGASDGRISNFLRERQSSDCIVFLDEFEKIKDLVDGFGHGHAKKIYQAFLEPWQEGTLTGKALDLDYVCTSHVIS